MDDATKAKAYDLLTERIREDVKGYERDLEDENFGINRLGTDSEQRMWSRFDGAAIALQTIVNYADSIEEAWS